MAKKPLQFNVPGDFRKEIEKIAKEKEVTMSELLRQSVRIYILLEKYTSQGYEITLKKTENGREKEIILP